jgi:hypothetical protein
VRLNVARHPPYTSGSSLRGLHFSRGLVCLLVGNLVAGAVLFALFATRVSRLGAGQTGVRYVPLGLFIAVGVTAGLMGLTRERRVANVLLGALTALAAWLIVELYLSL